MVGNLPVAVKAHAHLAGEEAKLAAPGGGGWRGKDGYGFAGTAVGDAHGAALRDDLQGFREAGFEVADGEFHGGHGKKARPGVTSCQDGQGRDLTDARGGRADGDVGAPRGGIRGDFSPRRFGEHGEDEEMEDSPPLWFWSQSTPLCLCAFVRIFFAGIFLDSWFHSPDGALRLRLGPARRVGPTLRISLRLGFL